MSIFNKKSDNKPEFIDENTVFNDRQLGDLNEGVNETDKGTVNVNVVSRKAIKAQYQVGGVLDQEQNNNWKAWLYLAPALILMAVFLIYPLINTFAISFLKNYDQIEGTSDGFTFDNFAMVLGLKESAAGGVEYNFLKYYLLNTFVIVIVTVPVSIFIALMIAVLLNNLKWFQKIYQTIFFLPYVTNAIAVGMVFKVMFEKEGLVNSIFNSHIDWMFDKNSRWVMMVPLCINIVWKSIPFKILILLSGLQNVDKQYYQAAKIDAAPQWKVLTKITVPALSPQILYLMVTSFIAAFKEYTAVVGMFGEDKADKNVKTVVFYIYENMRDPDKIGLASAAAVILFAIILAFTFLQLWLSKKKVQY